MICNLRLHELTYPSMRQSAIHERSSIHGVSQFMPERAIHYSKESLLTNKTLGAIIRRWSEFQALSKITVNFARCNLEKKINRFIKLYPLYYGLVGDLLFYIAIDTLFLTSSKSFSASEIVSLSAISQLVCVLLQFPILLLIKKIGNTASVRLGALCILLSSLFITFGKSYYFVLLGIMIHEVDIILLNASVVALENNLDLVGRRGDFVRVRTAGDTAYSVITMIIAFVVGYMFNLNHYLPMIGCVTTCAIGFVLSFFMKDYSNYNKILVEKKKGRVKITYGKTILLMVLLFSGAYALMISGQTNGKLFIQETSLLDFDIDKTALIISAIVCVSRIIRVISNISFPKIYRRYNKKLGVALPTLLGVAMCCMVFGSFIPQVTVKIVMMALGYSLILFIRDPYKIFTQDVILDSTPKEQHQTLLVLLSMGTKVVTAGMGLVFSAILLGAPMFAVVTIILVMSIIAIILSFIIYKNILIGKAQKSVDT